MGEHTEKFYKKNNKTKVIINLQTSLKKRVNLENLLKKITMQGGLIGLPGWKMDVTPKGLKVCKSRLQFNEWLTGSLHWDFPYRS
jgi:hypothetical protein